MPTVKGDFILLEYTAKVKESGEIFDTSSADVARQANIFRENANYEPILVVLGENWVLKSLDEKLIGLEVGKKETVEIPPEKAFGFRDPSKIKSIPLKKFDTKTPLRPGMEIELEGRTAVVRSVGAGRVLVDFNLPLAGRTLVYEVEVKGLLKTPLEKIRGLIHRRLPSVPPEKFGVDIRDRQVEIVVAEEALSLEGLNLALRGIAFDIQKFFPEIDVVQFVERYERKSVKAESGKEEPKPQSADVHM
ncbi:MAG: FKBP-type peptidyl-prolyl cis-trans isomerase [Candidatus Bathyarchaeia archaeon]